MCIICAGILAQMVEDKILDEPTVKYYRKKITGMIYDDLLPRDPMGGYGVLMYLANTMNGNGHPNNIAENIAKKLAAQVVAQYTNSAPPTENKFTEEMLEKIEEDLKKGRVH